MSVPLISTRTLRVSAVPGDHSAWHARFIVGIDLGTTNSAVAYVDTAATRAVASQSFAIPQLVGEGAVAERPTLPSFLYLGGEHDVAPGALALPWDAQRDYAVGEFARAQGARVPGRLVVVGEVVALPRRRRPRGGDPAVGGARRRAASCRRSRRRRATWRTSARPGTQRFAGRAAGSAGRRAHRARLVRRGGARAHRRRRASAPACRASSLLEEPQAAFYAWIDAPRRRRGRSDLRRRAPRAGRRRRRRHHRLQPHPRRAASGERLGARTPRGRRPHPARRRQHRRRAGAPARAAPRRASSTASAGTRSPTSAAPPRRRCSAPTPADGADPPRRARPRRRRRRAAARR